MSSALNIPDPVEREREVLRLAGLSREKNAEALLWITELANAATTGGRRKDKLANANRTTDEKLSSASAAAAARLNGLNATASIGRSIAHGPAPPRVPMEEESDGEDFMTFLKDIDGGNEPAATIDVEEYEDSISRRTSRLPIWRTTSTFAIRMIPTSTLRSSR